MRRGIAIGGSALAFGVLIAVVKGQDVGVRDALGNLSAPWVVVPFAAGAAARSVRRGVLLGLGATLLALLGFYLAEAAVLNLGPHPWYVDLRLTLHWNVYDTWGVPTGIAYGALGALWTLDRSRLAGASVGVTFVAEPLIVFALEHRRIWGGAGTLQYPWLWASEVAVGLALLTILAAKGGAQVMGIPRR